jgi:hypothetical protein
MRLGVDRGARVAAELVERLEQRQPDAARELVDEAAGDIRA